jgi:hypothetical protein
MSWATLSASCNRVAFNRLGSVSVVAGAVTGRGFLKMNSEMLVGDQIISIDYGFTCEVALFGHLTYGSDITIDGTAYTVRHEPMRIDDGTFCLVPLAKAALVTNSIMTLNGLRLVTLSGQYLTTIAA